MPAAPAQAVPWPCVWLSEQREHGVPGSATKGHTSEEEGPLPTSMPCLLWQSQHLQSLGCLSLRQHSPPHCQGLSCALGALGFLPAEVVALLQVKSCGADFLGPPGPALVLLHTGPRSALRALGAASERQALAQEPG